MRNMAFVSSGTMKTFPIIEKLGGIGPVFDRLSAKGHLKTRRAIGMWARTDRAGIPGEATRELMAMADELGISYTAADFVLSDASNAA